MSQLSFLDDISPSRAISTDIFDYQPALFTPQESAFYKDKFMKEIDWSQRAVLMYGREVMTPRLTAWYGDDGVQTDKTSQPPPWTPELLEIKKKVEPLAGVTFHYVLLNYYRDGSDSVSWHDDQDGKPGKNKIVASVSFGQERYFDIRNKADHSNKTSVLLEDGSYILMKGEFQDKWQHRIAKSSKPMQPRINLTF